MSNLLLSFWNDVVQSADNALHSFFGMSASHQLGIVLIIMLFLLMILMFSDPLIKDSEQLATGIHKMKREDQRNWLSLAIIVLGVHDMGFDKGMSDKHLKRLTKAITKSDKSLVKSAYDHAISFVKSHNFLSEISLANKFPYGEFTKAMK